MRLLDVSTFNLVDKREHELPPYAILSHTWGNDDDEVTLQDMLSLTADGPRGDIKKSNVSRKSGFAKIAAAARLALSQKLDFIWVDTCCIDKTSSAELSEAINSMFRWYQASAACYALLSDVKVEPNKDVFDSSMAASAGNSLPLADTVTQELRSSRWFTRGWTLQELVAPSNVHFYSREWTYLGSKKDKNGFQDLISGITGITAVILDGLSSVEELSVAQRMQWASGRHTTRSEDLAYCLMGIFGVNMPLLYGEGMKSFARLQEEILKGMWVCKLYTYIPFSLDFAFG
jgi:hypothetical protein